VVFKKKHDKNQLENPDIANTQIALSFKCHFILHNFKEKHLKLQLFFFLCPVWWICKDLSAAGSYLYLSMGFSQVMLLSSVKKKMI